MDWVTIGALIKNKPKPLLNINGRPILEHCINKLEEADIKTIYISVNHMSEQIIDFIKSKKFKSKIIPIKEKIKLGTIGSLYLIKKKSSYPAYSYECRPSYFFAYLYLNFFL